MKVAAAFLAILFLAPSIMAEHFQDDEGQRAAFDHRGGNEWWVEVSVDDHLSGRDVSAVDAKDEGGDWVPLELKSWGEWAGSFHIEPGHDVRFRAHFERSETTIVSCWFSHPDGEEDCTTTDERLSAATYVRSQLGASERVQDVAIDSDGTAVVVGTGFFDQDHGAGFIARYDQDGTRVWNRNVDAGPNTIALHDGHIYVAGVVAQVDAPGNFWQDGPSDDDDVWVAKFTADGAMVWQTSFGGSARDLAHGIGVTPSEVVVVGGHTNSCDYPIAGPASQPEQGDGGHCDRLDGFVTRLTASGQHAVYSTYLGGGLSDFVGDLTVTPDDRTHVVGYTTSENFPVTDDAIQSDYGGRRDGFYVVMDGFSEHQYSTYMGGPERDALSSVAALGTSVLVTGGARSLSYPTTSDGFQTEHSGGLECGHIEHGGPDPVIEDVPCMDIVVTRFDADHTIAYSTFYGNQYDEMGGAVAAGPDGRMHVVGDMRDERAFPTTEPIIGPGEGFSEIFLLSLSADGQSVERAVKLGGTDADYASGVAADPEGLVWLSGYTDSYDMPTTEGAQSREQEHPFDGYLARLKEPGEGVTFDSRNGNEWWVQVHVTGAEPSRVQAMDTGDPWVEMELKDWGDWARSFHVEPGNDVRFRAMVDGTWQESCWFTHPEGKAPDGSDTCTTGGTSAPSDFDASFDTPGGNEWWVEVYVDGNEPIAAVDARDDGGPWVALEKKDWGSWARSFHVEDGSIVEFRATSGDGDTDISQGYRWPSGDPA